MTKVTSSGEIFEVNNCSYWNFLPLYLSVTMILPLVIMMIWVTIFLLVSMLIMGLLRMFGTPVIFLSIPIILSELVLAGWLIVKGFNQAAIDSFPE